MAFANKERIARTLEALAQYGATTGGGVTRRATPSAPVFWAAGRWPDWWKRTF